MNSSSIKKLNRSLPLFLAAALQTMPLVRSALPAMTQGCTPSAWAFILKIATGAVTLFGYHAISGASGIVISPAVATNGVPYHGLIQYSGAHSSAVSSWKMTANWLGSQSVACGGPYQIAPGLWATNSSSGICQVGGIPNTSTPGANHSFTMKIYDASGCGSGDNDTQTSKIIIYAASATPPAILVQPQPQSLTAGSSCELTATANGSATLIYQWALNDAPIPGANASSLTLTNVRTNQAGNYTVIITNSAGAVTSSPALVSVSIPTAPNITPPLILNGIMRFSFTPVTGLVNTVFTSDSSSGTNWSELISFPPPTSTTPITVSDSIGNTFKFYRVGFSP